MSGTIGTSAPRARDLQLLTGRGRYVADLDLPGQAGHGSSAARSRMPGCSASRRRRHVAHEGVLAVLTAATCPTCASRSGSRSRPRPRARGCSSRSSRGASCATSASRSRSSSQRIRGRRRTPRSSSSSTSTSSLRPETPSCASAGGAARPRGARLERRQHDPAPLRRRRGGLRRADVVVRRRLELPRQTGAPLETRGLLAEPVGEGVTIHGAAKVKHFNRDVLAELLGLALDACASSRSTSAAASASAASSTPRTCSSRSPPSASAAR